MIRASTKSQNADDHRRGLTRGRPFIGVRCLEFFTVHPYSNLASAFATGIKIVRGLGVETVVATVPRRVIIECLLRIGPPIRPTDGIGNVHCFVDFAKRVWDLCRDVLNKHGDIESLLGSLGLHGNSASMIFLFDRWKNEIYRSVFAIQEKAAIGLPIIVPCLINFSKRVIAWGCDCASRFYWLMILATKEKQFWDAISFLLWMCCGFWSLDLYIRNKQVCGWVIDGFAPVCVASFLKGVKDFVQDSKIPSPILELFEYFIALFSGGLAKTVTGEVHAICNFNDPIYPIALAYIQHLQFGAWCLGYIFGDAINFFGWYCIFDFFAIFFKWGSLASLIRVDQLYQLPDPTSPIHHGLGFAKSKAGLSIQLLTLIVVWVVIITFWNEGLGLEESSHLTAKMYAQIVARLKGIASTVEFDELDGKPWSSFIGSICIRYFYYCLVVSGWLTQRTKQKIDKVENTEPTSIAPSSLQPSPSPPNGIDDIEKLQTFCTDYAASSLHQPNKKMTKDRVAMTLTKSSNITPSPPKIITAPRNSNFRVSVDHDVSTKDKKTEESGDCGVKIDKENFRHCQQLSNESSEESRAKDCDGIHIIPWSNKPKLALSKYYKLPPRKLKQNYVTWIKSKNPSGTLFSSLFICPVTEEIFLAGPFSDLGFTVTQNSKWRRIKGNDAIRGEDGFYWYPRKIVAEHAAAARALDCLMMRNGNGVKGYRLSGLEPFWPSDRPELPIDWFPEQVLNQIPPQWRATDQSLSMPSKIEKTIMGATVSITCAVQTVQVEHSTTSESSPHEALDHCVLSLKDNVTKNEGLNSYIPIDKKAKRLVGPALYLEDNESNLTRKGSQLKQKIVDSLSPIEVFTEHEDQSLKDYDDVVADISMLSGMLYLKKKKERQQRQRKFILPPPNFRRMKERKQQKESQAQHQQECRDSQEEEDQGQEQQKRVTNRPPLGFPKIHNRPQRPEIIINGRITEAIPEEFEICLGSPSNKERVREFKKMLQEERLGRQNE